MRTTLLALCTALASSLVMAAATPANQSAPADRAAAASLHVATLVCGSGGCAPIHTKQEKQRKFQTMGHG
ncbi:MAG TPA: hypothetical protein VH206_02085 [Xanthobacteraceae bacterium]|jgi:hypothetical protein|nr:hypothetical protein [Xanthobacteraceae bacterium]